MRILALAAIAAGVGAAWNAEAQTDPRIISGLQTPSIDYSGLGNFAAGLAALRNAQVAQQLAVQQQADQLAAARAQSFRDERLREIGKNIVDHKCDDARRLALVDGNIALAEQVGRLCLPALPALDASQDLDAILRADAAKQTATVTPQR